MIVPNQWQINIKEFALEPSKNSDKKIFCGILQKQHNIGARDNLWMIVFFMSTGKKLVYFLCQLVKNYSSYLPTWLGHTFTFWLLALKKKKSHRLWSLDIKCWCCSIFCCCFLFPSVSPLYLPPSIKCASF